MNYYATVYIILVFNHITPLVAFHTYNEHKQQNNRSYNKYVRSQGRPYIHTCRPTCIDYYTRTVSEWTRDNTVSFGLRGMTRRFRDCLSR